MQNVFTKQNVHNLKFVWHCLLKLLQKKTNCAKLLKYVLVAQLDRALPS